MSHSDLTGSHLPQASRGSHSLPVRGPDSPFREGAAAEPRLYWARVAMGAFAWFRPPVFSAFRLYSRPRDPPAPVPSRWLALAAPTLSSICCASGQQGRRTRSGGVQRLPGPPVDCGRIRLSGKKEPSKGLVKIAQVHRLDASAQREGFRLRVGLRG